MTFPSAQCAQTAIEVASVRLNIDGSLASQALRLHTLALHARPSFKYAFKEGLTLSMDVIWKLSSILKACPAHESAYIR